MDSIIMANEGHIDVYLMFKKNLLFNKTSSIRWFSMIDNVDF